MEIETLKVSQLIPYKNNPRRNDDSVDAVAESIREFGFKVPIIIDRNNIVVCGHTRLKAAKKLKMKEVPCIRANDLTDEQICAFRLADNKVSESSIWDFDKLDDELGNIFDLDMSRFGFALLKNGSGEPDSKGEENAEDDGYYGDARERTSDAYNLEDFDTSRSDGFYEMPVIEPVDFMPDDLIGFNYVLSTERRDAGVHFFIDDYQFERIWNDPAKYISILQEFPCVLTPDFSLYMDMPMAMKIWNIYRSRLIGQMMQDAGITVIPTLSWAEPETFSFCFDGLMPGGTVAVSTVGVMRDEGAGKIWTSGMDEAIRRLQPKQILCYGSEIAYDFKDIPVQHFEARKFSE